MDKNILFTSFWQNYGVYVNDVNKIRSHGNTALFSKDAECVNIQSDKI